MNANYTCNSTTDEPSVLIASHEEALYFIVSGSPIHNDSREQHYLAGIHCHLRVHMASPGECLCLYYCDDRMVVRKRSWSSTLQRAKSAVATTKSKRNTPAFARVESACGRRRRTNCTLCVRIRLYHYSSRGTNAKTK